MTFPANPCSTAALHSLSDLVDLGELQDQEQSAIGRALGIESTTNEDGADPPSEPDRETIRLSDDRLTLILMTARDVERNESRALADAERLSRLEG